MATVQQSTITYDQGKYLAASLIKRSRLRLVAFGLCDPNQMPEGNGLTAYFVRYSRMNVPLATLTEGTTPTPSSISLEQVTVTLDQWGDLIKITDIAQATAKHPLVQQAVALLADNAARVIDREIQIVWLANTNVQYFDGTRANRAAIVYNTDYISDNVIHQAVVSMVDDGVNPRSGPAMQDIQKGGQGSINGGAKYVGIAGPQVMRDIMQAGTSLGTWVSTKMYNSPQALYNAEAGEWLGVRWVETNFIPKFTCLGNATGGALVSGNAFGTGTPVVTAVDGGGSLTSATTYYYKVTRTHKARGFEEDISLEWNTASAATGNNESFTFNFSGLSSNYLYKIYFGSATGDSNLKIVSSAGHEADTTVTVTSVPATTTTAPANVNATNRPTVHPVYILGAEACFVVSLKKLQTYMVRGADKTDPLDQFMYCGYKFLQKAVVADSSRILRVEVVSRFS